MYRYIRNSINCFLGCRAISFTCFKKSKYVRTSNSTKIMYTHFQTNVHTYITLCIWWLNTQKYRKYLCHPPPSPPPHNQHLYFVYCTIYLRMTRVCSWWFGNTSNDDRNNLFIIYNIEAYSKPLVFNQYFLIISIREFYWMQPSYNLLSLRWNNFEVWYIHTYTNCVYTIVIYGMEWYWKRERKEIWR